MCCKSSIWVDIVFCYFIRRPIIDANASGTILFCTKTTIDYHGLEEKRAIVLLSLSSTFLCIFLYVLFVCIASFVCSFLAFRPSSALVEKDNVDVSKQYTTLQCRCGVPLQMSSLVQKSSHRQNLGVWADGKLTLLSSLE